MNIAGVMITAHPEQISGITQQLHRLMGVEVHAYDEKGKMVITIEQDNENEIADTLEKIQATPGVLAAAMVYHSFDELTEPATQEVTL